MRNFRNVLRRDRATISSSSPALPIIESSGNSSTVNSAGIEPAALASTATWPSRTPSSHLIHFHVGIKVWQDNANPTVDICFIHGLFGNWESTWTASSHTTPWPKTLLGPRLKNARIFTYGYDAHPVRRTDTSSNRLLDHAANLLTDLAGDRLLANASSRPLIFVAHSLGGLVVKQAMIVSHFSADKHLRDISASTKGIAFMGTPHQGSWMAEWAQIPASVVGVAGMATSLSMLQVLQTSDQFLDSNQIGFLQMVRGQIEGEKMEITCFFEELGMPVVGKVVTKESAAFPGYNCISMYANHRDMVRIASGEDTNFKRLLYELTRWERAVVAGGTQLQQSDPTPMPALESLLAPSPAPSQTSAPPSRNRGQPPQVSPRPTLSPGSSSNETLRPQPSSVSPHSHQYQGNKGQVYHFYGSNNVNQTISNMPLSDNPFASLLIPEHSGPPPSVDESARIQRLSSVCCMFCENCKSGITYYANSYICLAQGCHLWLCETCNRTHTKHMGRVRFVTKGWADSATDFALQAPLDCVRCAAGGVRARVQCATGYCFFVMCIGCAPTGKMVWQEHLRKTGTNAHKAPIVVFPERWWTKKERRVKECVCYEVGGVTAAGHCQRCYAPWMFDSMVFACRTCRQNFGCAQWLCQECYLEPQEKSHAEEHDFAKCWIRYDGSLPEDHALPYFCPTCQDWLQEGEQIDHIHPHPTTSSITDGKETADYHMVISSKRKDLLRSTNYQICDKARSAAN